MAVFLKNLDKILNTKTNLSQSSINIYKNRLLKIKNDLDIKSNTINFLNDFNFIKNYLTTNYNTPNTIKSYLSAIIKIIEFNNKINTLSKEKYLEFRKELQNSIEQVNMNNIIKKEDTVSLDKLKSIYTFNYPFDNSKQYIKKLNDNLLLYIHINYPKRLDYMNLHLNYFDDIHKHEYPNYLEVNKKNIILYLSKYKTAKTYGPYIKQFDNFTYDLINRYITEFNTIYGYKPKLLFYHYIKGEPKMFTDKRSWSTYITHLLEMRTGKHLTNNDLRKIYETDYIRDPDYKNKTNAEKQLFSNDLQHSHATAIKDYYKITV